MQLDRPLRTDPGHRVQRGGASDTSGDVRKQPQRGASTRDMRTGSPTTTLLALQQHLRIHPPLHLPPLQPLLPQPPRQRAVGTHPRLPLGPAQPRPPGVFGERHQRANQLSGSESPQPDGAGDAREPVERGDTPGAREHHHPTVPHPPQQRLAW